jgi:pimeloyl-ACP methyl ester carboxylesterase
MVSGSQQLYIPGTAHLGVTSPSWFTAAWLTIPDVLRRDELQILVHGAGYDHRYWDWPMQPELYSYVAWAAKEGAATLALDRIGSGASSKPPGMDNTVAAQAELLSEIAFQARNGLAGSRPFTRVTLIGHSLGSVIAGYASARYGNVDALVLTGYIPRAGAARAGGRRFGASLLSAKEALPHLFGLIDDDYLTANREWRTDMHWSSNADPMIITVDEAIKGSTTRGELSDVAMAAAAIPRAQVPTLVVVGQDDRVLIDEDVEKDCFDSVRSIAPASPPNFEFRVVEATGHNLNLHPTAHDFFSMVAEWLESLDFRVGHGGVNE